MADILRKRLKQTAFESPYHEATLALLVAGNTLNERMDRLCTDHGISRQQYNILRILKGAHGDGYQCGDIASRMLDRAPDITRRIDGLEKLGLVERSRSVEDRRVVITRITQKGDALLTKLQPGLNELNDMIARQLTKAECKTIIELCERLIELGG